jgi:arylsulfatase A-like enzyme
MKPLSINPLLHLSTIGIIAGLSSCAVNPEKKAADTTRPNIIYILADDLGYGDLGCYGQDEIETPNIDKLAQEGMLFTQHYTGAPVCAPARCMLMTGMHSGKAQVRGNDEWSERGDVWDYYAMLADSSLEGQRPLKAGTNTIGRALQSVGYKTAIVGKWGLGAPGSEGTPNKQGFDFFFGYNCQRQAHTYYPVHLWKNEQRYYLNNDTVAPHLHLPEDLDPYDINSYADFNLNDYSATLMMDEITQFVDENKNEPFFLYWATPIPHLPLQAPKKWVDYYVNKFGDEEPYTGTVGRGGYFPTRYPHATYAAMISYMDEQVGKLIEQLKSLGLYENTLIIFSSDNGPSGFYTPRFSSGAPFRTQSGYNKGTLYEGGIRVPMIASWPLLIKPGTVSNHISSFPDVFPTLTEITGAQNPTDLSGISFLPALKGEDQQDHEYLYWEFPGSGGQLAVRIGNMKALSKSVRTAKTLEWELFDIVKDPEERNNLASENPELIKRVNEIVAREHTPSHNDNWKYKVLGDN